MDTMWRMVLPATLSEANDLTVQVRPATVNSALLAAVSAVISSRTQAQHQNSEQGLSQAVSKTHLASRTEHEHHAACPPSLVASAGILRDSTLSGPGS